MPSFDIVSQVNPMEIENAVNQAKKELANRFDFKGSTAEILLEKDEIKLSAEDQFKIRALSEIVMTKLAKRSISLKNIERPEPDVSPLGHARQIIKIKQGLEPASCKTDHGFYPGSQAQGHHPDPGERDPCDLKEPRRASGGHRRRPWCRLSFRAAVCEL
jgi:hypothetical protein